MVVYLEAYLPGDSLEAWSYTHVRMTYMPRAAGRLACAFIRNTHKCTRDTHTENLLICDSRIKSETEKLRNKSERLPRILDELLFKTCKSIPGTHFGNIRDMIDSLEGVYDALDEAPCKTCTLIPWRSSRTHVG